MPDWNYADAHRAWQYGDDGSYFFVRVHVGRMPIKWHNLGTYSPRDMAKELRKVARSIEQYADEYEWAEIERKSRRKKREKVEVG